MKVFQSSVVRALCAIIVGALIVKYRELTVTWITIAIGVLFFLSGVFSCVTYFIARGKKNDIQVFDADGRLLTGMKPTFPIVGLGSLILGLILALMPNTFVQSLMYILAAILILGAISQMANLVAVSRMARIGFYYWIMPALTLLIGIVAIVSPSSIASAPLFVIGSTMLVYGILEPRSAILLHHVRSSIERNVSTTVNEDDQQPKDGKTTIGIFPHAFRENPFANP